MLFTYNFCNHPPILSPAGYLIFVVLINELKSWILFYDFYAINGYFNKPFQPDF